MLNQLALNFTTGRVPFLDYLFIVSPPERIQKEITEFKKLYVQKFGEAQYIYSKPHITITTFYLQEKYEADMLKKLTRCLASIAKFKLTLNSFGAFENNGVVYVNPLNHNLIELIKEADLTVRSEVINAKSVYQKITNPHITIAKTGSPIQFSKSWQYFKHIYYQNSFDVDDITVLRRKRGSLKWSEYCRLPLK